VLVVDDQNSMGKLAMLYLQARLSPYPRIAGWGDDETLVSCRQYDLVVLDWELGDTNGLDVLMVIRALTLNKTAAVLIATGENKLGNVQSAMSAGSSHDITRPCSDVALCSRLERAVMCKLAA
jgi:DNA-binding response OmpR family regulator